MSQAGGISTERVSPNLYVHRVSDKGRAELAAALGVPVSAIHPIRDASGNPTIRMNVDLTREQAANYLTWSIGKVGDVIKQIETTHAPLASEIAAAQKKYDNLRKNNAPTAEIKAAREHLDSLSYQAATGLTMNQVADIQSIVGDIKALQDALGYEVKPSDITIRQAQKLCAKLSGEVLARASHHPELIDQISDVLDMTTREGVARYVHTTERVTKSTYEIFRDTMKEVSEESERAYRRGAKATVAQHKNLAAYAKIELEKLPISSYQRDVLLNAVASARTGREQIHAMAAVQRVADKVKYNVAAGKLKKTIRSLSKYKIGNQPLLGLSNEAQAKITAALKDVDTKTLSSSRRVELEKLESLLIDVGFDLSAGIQNNPSIELDAMAEIIGAAQVKELGRLRAKPLKELTPSQIEQIDDAIKFALYQHRQYLGDLAAKRNEIKLANESSSIAEIAPRWELPKDTGGSEKSKLRAVGGVVVSAKRSLWEGSMHKGELVYHTTGKESSVMGKILDEDIHRGKVAYLGKFRESRDTLAAELKRIGWNTDDIANRHKKHTVTIGGESHRITTGEIMSLTMHMRSSRNLEQITRPDTKGLVFPNRTTKMPTVSELANMQRYLSPKELTILDFIPTLNQKHMMESVNETWSQMFGHEIAKDPSYWSLPRRTEAQVGTKTTGRFVENMGMFKPFTGGVEPIVINDFWDQLLRTMQGSASLNGTAIPMRNARELLNSTDFINEMRNAGRGTEYDKLRTLFGRMQGVTSDRIEMERIAGGILARAGKGAIARPSAYLAQLGSWFMAFDSGLIPMQYAKPVVGYRVQSGDAQAARMDKYSPLLWMRHRGGRTNIITGMSAINHGVDMLLFNHVPKSEYALAPLRIFDRRVMLMLDKSVQRWVAKERTDLQPGSDEFWKEVAIRTEDVVRKSQPMWDIDERSEISSSDNPLFKATTMFRSAREAIFNRVLHAATRVGMAKTDAEHVAALDQMGTTVAVTAVSLLSVRLMKDSLKHGLGKLASLVAPGDPERRYEAFYSDKNLDRLEKNLRRDVADIIPVFGRLAYDAAEAIFSNAGYGKVEFKQDNILLSPAKYLVDTATAIKRAQKQYAKDGDKKELTESILRIFNTFAELWTMTTGHAVGGVAQLSTQPMIRAMSQPTDQELQVLANRLRNAEDKKNRRDIILDLKSHGIETTEDLNRLFNEYDYGSDKILDNTLNKYENILNIPMVEKMKKQEQAVKEFEEQ